MAYSITDQRIGYPAISATDAGFTPPSSSTVIPTPPAALGQVVRAFDATLGEGEFIFLKGVASTVVGSLVVWDGSTYQTTLATTTTNQGRPVAVAMAATTAALWGWYQIGGTCTVQRSTGAKTSPLVALGVLSTGKVGAVATGKGIQGARSANAATVASATTTILMVVDRPHFDSI
jgi:hypothetical protein